ncbi:hypothetical protein EDB80DRAFT_414082 [Ilyonectria destructans]|nr:hypothetical protein EDB80DRAFT_414082 [Ilyonectria destructans]
MIPTVHGSRKIPDPGKFQRLKQGRLDFPRQRRRQTESIPSSKLSEAWIPPPDFIGPLDCYEAAQYFPSMSSIMDGSSPCTGAQLAARLDSQPPTTGEELHYVTQQPTHSGSHCCCYINQPNISPKIRPLLPHHSALKGNLANMYPWSAESTHMGPPHGQSFHVLSKDQTGWAIFSEAVPSPGAPLPPWTQTPTTASSPASVFPIGTPRIGCASMVENPSLLSPESLETLNSAFGSMTGLLSNENDSYMIDMIDPLEAQHEEARTCPYPSRNTLSRHSVVEGGFCVAKNFPSEEIRLNGHDRKKYLPQFPNSPSSTNASLVQNSVNIGDRRFIPALPSNPNEWMQPLPSLAANTPTLNEGIHTAISDFENTLPTATSNEDDITSEDDTTSLDRSPSPWLESWYEDDVKQDFVEFAARTIAKSMSQVNAVHEFHVTATDTSGSGSQGPMGDESKSNLEQGQGEFLRLNQQAKRYNGDPGEDNGDDGPPEPKRQKVMQPPDGPVRPGPMYACPYQKRFPEESALCGIPHGSKRKFGWETVSRVKQHLLESHARDHHCQNCWKAFKKVISAVNCRQERNCSKRDRPPKIWLTDAQIARLRAERFQSRDDGWYRIFGLLFQDSQENGSEGYRAKYTPCMFNLLDKRDLPADSIIPSRLR